jgi:hypothetical protein
MDRIHVDSRGPYDPLCGGRYGGMTPEAAAALMPRVRCPHCDGAVTRLGGEANVRHTPPPGVDVPADLIYSAEPCGCRVHESWAGAFSAEIARRLMGETPAAVTDGMTPAERDRRRRALEDEIAHHSGFAKHEDPEVARRAQYRALIAVDRLMRLVPGSHNRVPKVAVGAEVLAWARKNGMAVPGAPSPGPEEGYGEKYPMPVLGVDLGSKDESITITVLFRGNRDGSIRVLDSRPLDRHAAGVIREIGRRQLRGTKDIVTVVPAAATVREAVDTVLGRIAPESPVPAAAAPGDDRGSMATGTAPRAYDAARRPVRRVNISRADDGD